MNEIMNTDLEMKELAVSSLEWTVKMYALFIERWECLSSWYDTFHVLIRRLLSLRTRAYLIKDIDPEILRRFSVPDPLLQI